MLQQKEVDHQALNDKRLEHLWCVTMKIYKQSNYLNLITGSKKQNEKDRQVRCLRSDHVKGDLEFYC